MKSALFLLLLALCSFTVDQRDKEYNVYYISVNDELFHVRSRPYFTKAETNSVSVGDNSHTIYKLNFPGPVYTLRSQKQFAENLQLLLGFNEGVLDTNYFASLLYQGEYYYVLRDSSTLDVTQFELPGNSTLLVSAKLQGLFRNYNYRLNGKKDIRVKLEVKQLILAALTNDILISSAEN